MAQVSSQMLALLSESGRHTVPPQSASLVQSLRQPRVSAVWPAHTVPSQHAEFIRPPHGAPCAPQVQYCAAAQKPVVLFEKGTQQPVAHCALVVQVGRQPA
jgi:hypothetical protein